MKAENVELKVVVNSDRAVKQLDSATRVAERLRIELDKIKGCEISVSVTDVKRKWYQFWK